MLLHKYKTIEDLSIEELREELKRVCDDKLKLEWKNMKLRESLDSSNKDTKSTIRRLYNKLNKVELNKSKLEIKVLNQRKEIEKLLISKYNRKELRW